MRIEAIVYGVKLVWILDAQNQTVITYRSLTDVRELTVDDTLGGADILPGLSIQIKELFED